MLILLRILLTFNATSLLLIVYAVKSVPFEACGTTYRAYILPVGLLAIPIILTGISLRLARRLPADDFPLGSIASLSQASNTYLPSYLGYFFVALSAPNVPTLVFVYAVLFVFTYSSQALYFNPLFLLFKYRFYSIRTNEGVEAFLVSKQDWRTPDQVFVRHASRMNGFTFIDGKV